MDQETAKLRDRVLSLFYGDTPTPTQRLAYYAVAGIPDSVAELVDLSDDELHEALKSTIERILRVPS
jgi:hypothetical protein